MGKSFLFAVKFDMVTKRFVVLESDVWIGGEVFDHSEEESRYAEGAEISYFYGLKQLLGTGIESVNKVLGEEQVRVEFDKLIKQ